MVLYRGLLKSCNYRCSYCPFSKHRHSGEELLKDREKWFQFVEKVEQEALPGDHCLMVVPYGEALIHPWYWDGLGRLSRLPSFGAVGAQTNFSFPLEEALERFFRAGGKSFKLRLWATFHPEMVTVEAFAEKCRKAMEAGILLCAGAVGAPENMALLESLRASLPDELYLWVNKLDGLKRPYTQAEIQGFMDIDPFFYRELRLNPANPKLCAGRVFAQGDGKLGLCSISPSIKEKWDGDEPGAGIFSERIFLAGGICSRKRCSCYLAYGGRKDLMNQVLFGPYPIFRIPRRPKAVFLDIDGTLIPKGSRQIPQDVEEDLAALAKNGGTYLLFATSLPLAEAKKRCGKVWHLFCGGVFAGGAHLRLGRFSEKGREMVHPFEGNRLIPAINALREKLEGRPFRLLVYREKGAVYKISLVRPAQRPWEEKEAGKIAGILKREWDGEGIRVFTEGSCMQIVSAAAAKAKGVRQICRWLGIAPREAVAAGDGMEDQEMLSLCQGINLSEKS